MENQTFLGRWSMHLGYCSVIIGLLAWIYAEKAHARDFQFACSETLNGTSRILRDYQQSDLAHIIKEAEAYPKTQYVQYYHNAHIADSLTNCFQKIVDQSLVTGPSPTGRNKDREVQVPLSATQIAVLQKGANLLRDTLSNLIGYAPGISERALHPMPDDLIGHHNRSPYVSRFLRSANVMETMLVLELLRLRADLAKCLIFRHYAKKLNVINIDGGNWYDPVMSPQNLGVAVNEWFVANVFLGCADQGSWGMRIFVDEEEIPVVAGKAILKRRYASPGLKKLFVRIEQRHPLTHEVRNFTKDFRLNILPTCLPERKSSQ